MMLGTIEFIRHGWVVPLPSGAKARCGGPAMCAICRFEQSMQGLVDKGVAKPATDLMLERHNRAFK
jgi:hypothetical protein